MAVKKCELIWLDWMTSGPTNSDEVEFLKYSTYYEPYILKILFWEFGTRIQISNLLFN